MTPGAAVSYSHRFSQWLSPFLLLAVQAVAWATCNAAAQAEQCPNRPAGRLEADDSPYCPVPGRIGIVPEEQDAISWSYPPKCMSQTPRSQDGPRLDCLFTSTTFRNGHGTSIVTSSTTASHLAGLEAFEDAPTPVIRDALGPAYEVVPFPGKRTGVVAKRRIRRGEIFMVDLPALFISVSFLADAKPHHRRRMLKQAINQLPEVTRSRVYGLPRGSAEYEVDAILGPNAHTVMVGDGEVHVGLFTEVARINHSCRPNAYFRFSERRLTVEVVAYHAIEPGDEITLSYVPLETPSSTRRQYLKSHWGFDCTCTLCTGPATDLEESESWRRKIKSLRETIANARSEGFYHDAIVMTEEWLMFAEWDMQPPLMAEYHDTLANLYFLKGDMVNATRHARMAVDEWVRLGSVDDEPLEKARLLLRRLEAMDGRRRGG
ncbi:hypothetical protein C8A03DRAFT_19746 [Achaetomium macrosporum]|uniref:SET domain-containing protein n=1 Tax=Achaetomium macrosporum TaxID=79813 RepID=A0AAN7H9P7_9PEZI|nr:hypothetical protein C8A03DRAFT_19746 [Achaetomium macrosporum]